MLGYERHADDGDRRIVLINFTDAEIEIGAGLVAAATIDVSTSGADRSPFTGTLAPDEAVILHPTDVVRP